MSPAYGISNGLEVTNDVFESEYFGVVNHAVNIGAIRIEGKMTADGFEPVRVELSFEFFGTQAIGAGEFHVSNSETLDFGQCAGNVAGKLLAQTIQLQTDRPLEI